MSKNHKNLRTRNLRANEIDNQDNVVHIHKNKKPVQQHQNNNLKLKKIQPLTENQELLFKAYNNNKNILGIGSAGTGKAQPLYSKILTKNGWITMGDICVGTMVLTPSGEESEVIGVFPQGKKNVYRVYLKDGSYTDCCLDHLWEINIPNAKNYRNGSHKEIVDTKKLIEYLQVYKSQNISLDVVSPIQFEHKDLSIPPYLLGVLLGDGGFTGGCVSLTTSDKEIVENVQQHLDENYIINKIPSSPYGYNIIREIKSGSINDYKQKLIEMGLWGKKSEEKSIPEDYMFSSIEQRRNLIKGLLDTDGTVCSRRGTVSYSTSSKVLANQVKEIILSLGGKCTISSKTPFYYGKNKERIYCHENYILHINHPTKKDFFTLNRKKELINRKFDSNQFRRQIVKIEHVGYEECKCILIDNSDHLYITDDYIITHNTFLSLYLMLNELESNKDYYKVKIIRTAQASKDIGHLPGNEKEKLKVYETPYMDMVGDLYGRSDAYEILKKKDMIEFVSTSYIRGTTWNNCLIIVDEFQNMDFGELLSVITRVGKNSRIAFLGDCEQNDLIRYSKCVSGFVPFLQILNIMPSFELIEFTIDDIVRSSLVKEFLLAKHHLNI